MGLGLESDFLDDEEGYDMDGEEMGFSFAKDGLIDRRASKRLSSFVDKLRADRVDEIPPAYRRLSNSLDSGKNFNAKGSEFEHEQPSLASTNLSDLLDELKKGDEDKNSSK